jgi:large subunit ribosomal protein L21
MAEKTAKPSSELSRSSASADAGIATRKSTTEKKAVILTGGKQYLVNEGQELNVELLDPASKPSFDALLVIDGNDTSVGTPLVEGIKVSADIVEQVVKADKVTAIRYKAKKRVHKTRGHRQKLTRIRITKIA